MKGFVDNKPMTSWMKDVALRCEVGVEASVAGWDESERGALQAYQVIRTRLMKAGYPQVWWAAAA